MTTWFLQAEIRDQMVRALENGFQIDAATRDAIGVAAAEYGKMQIIGNRAVIPIEGTLTQKRDFFAAYFGGGNTLYPDITGAIAQANEDPVVEGIDLLVGTSPGGNLDGLFATMDTIRDSVKPVRAFVQGAATSATYGLVSQASEIIAQNRATRFGSVGVAVDTWASSDEVSIASTEAPKKRPDMTTEEGQNVVRETLDEYHQLFAESIAQGRGTTVAKVNKNYGRGAVVLAETAIQAGMIDSIGAIEKSQTKQSATGGKSKGQMMNLEELKAEHPAVYAEAKAEGAREERDRAVAHLTLGEKCGDIGIATKAITEGTDMNATIQAQYMAAHMDKQMVNARVNDNPDLGAPKSREVANDFDSRVISLLEPDFEVGSEATNG